MDNVVKPQVELAVRSITESSGRGPSSMLQNRDQRDFTGNIVSTPLMSASSRVNLNIDQDRNDVTRKVENFEDGDFPALIPNKDRNAHAHLISSLDSQHLNGCNYGAWSKNSPPINIFTGCKKWPLLRTNSQTCSCRFRLKKESLFRF